MRIGRLLLVGILLGGSGSAGTRIQDEATGLTISGTVRVPGTGEPFSGATVRLTGAFGFGPGTGLLELATTDAQGRFRFTNLSAARYQLTPFSPRSEPIAMPSTSVELGEGAPPPNVALWLPQLSIVSGRVLGPDGSPLPNARVRVGHLEWFGGTRVLAVVPREVRTDEAGEYALPVPPGEYRLQVVPPDRDQFPPHYYPAAVRPEDAIPFSVAGGVDLFRMDVTVTDVEQYRVRFRLPISFTPLHGDEVPLRVTVRYLGPGLRKREVELHQPRALGDDTWQTGPLPPGDYELLIDYPPAILRLLNDVPPGLDPNLLRPIARLPVTIADEDVDLGMIETPVQPDIQGRVTVRQPAGPIDLAALPDLHFTDPTIATGRVASIDSDGGFVLERMPPGVFALFAVSLPEDWPDGWHIVSAMSGGRDVLRDGLLVGGTPNPIDIVIADDAAVISGVARDSSDDLIPGARIVLVPPPLRRGPVSRYPTTVADDAGVFMLRDVPPGDYTVVALDIVGGEGYQLVPSVAVYHYWEDPEFLRRHEPRGERITVDPGSRMVIDPETVLLSD